MSVEFDWVAIMFILPWILAYAFVYYSDKAWLYERKHGRPWWMPDENEEWRLADELIDCAKKHQEETMRRFRMASAWPLAEDPASASAAQRRLDAAAKRVAEVNAEHWDKYIKGRLKEEKGWSDRQIRFLEHLAKKDPKWAASVPPAWLMQMDRTCWTCGRDGLDRTVMCSDSCDVNHSFWIPMRWTKKYWKDWGPKPVQPCEGRLDRFRVSGTSVFSDCWLKKEEVEMEGECRNCCNYGTYGFCGNTNINVFGCKGWALKRRKKEMEVECRNCYNYGAHGFCGDPEIDVYCCKGWAPKRRKKEMEKKEYEIAREFDVGDLVGTDIDACGMRKHTLKWGAEKIKPGVSDKDFFAGLPQDGLDYYLRNGFVREKRVRRMVRDGQLLVDGVGNIYRLCVETDPENIDKLRAVVRNIGENMHHIRSGIEMRSSLDFFVYQDELPSWGLGDLKPCRFIKNVPLDRRNDPELIGRVMVDK